MQKLSPADIAKNKSVYDRVTSINNPDFWFGSHKEDNYERLNKVTELAKIPLAGTKCLDVGCGTGDLSKFLRERDVKDYLGIDIYEPSLKKAKEKYPSEMFMLIDLLDWKTDEKFDYVFCSGALSTRMSSDNYEFISSMIQKMWSFANIGISFNFLVEGYMENTDPEIFRYLLDKVLEICNTAINGMGQINYITDGDEAHIYLWRKTQ